MVTQTKPLVMVATYLDEETAAEFRVEAAREKASMSKLLKRLVHQHLVAMQRGSDEQ